MKFNLRQEIAMWVLGLPWACLGFITIVSDGVDNLLVNVAMELVLLVPISLILFSLRTRRKPEVKKATE
jgi:hypothetical protein